MAFPDFAKPFEIFCDFSGAGVCAILSQDGRPVMIKSRVCSRSEAKFSASRGEAAALKYALDSYESYVERCKVTIWTDHKTMNGLEKSNKTLSNVFDRIRQRLQELPLVEVKYVFTTDRDPWKEKLDGYEFNQEMKVFVAPDGRLVPRPEARLALVLHHHELAHSGKEVLFQALSRRYRWPDIRRHCDYIVRDCPSCRIVKAKLLERDSYKQWPHPEKPMSRLHIDFAILEGANIFIAVDAYTRFPFAAVVVDQTTSSALKEIDAICTDFDTPATIVSDNGPAFELTFKAQMAARGIKHILAIEYRPESNGSAEVFVRIIKRSVQLLRRSQPTLTIDDAVRRAVRAYRVLPCFTTGISPHELMFGRPPATGELLAAKVIRDFEKFKASPDPSNRGAKKGARIKVGDKVVITDPSGKLRNLPSILVYTVVDVKKNHAVISDGFTETTVPKARLRRLPDKPVPPQHEDDSLKGGSDDEDRFV